MSEAIEKINKTTKAIWIHFSIKSIYMNDYYPVFFVVYMCLVNLVFFSFFLYFTGVIDLYTNTIFFLIHNSEYIIILADTNDEFELEEILIYSFVVVVVVVCVCVCVWHWNLINWIWLNLFETFTFKYIEVQYCVFSCLFAHSLFDWFFFNKFFFFFCHFLFDNFVANNFWWK